MKKAGIWNGRLSAAVAALGHYETILICDAGFPVPQGVECIDLAVTRGLPSFHDVVCAVLQELVAEQYTIMDNMHELNPHGYMSICALLDRQPREECGWDAFLQHAARAKVCVRTGEDAPCSNVILRSATCYVPIAESHAIEFRVSRKQGFQRAKKLQR